ncbi:MAG: pyridoxal-phosphate dependent enzyme [Anaerolineales bacterium]|jgi:threonine synthase
MTHQLKIVCIDCGESTPFDPLEFTCPACGSAWRQAEYDLKFARRSWSENLPSRPFDLWRYQELLPTQNPQSSLMMGEGGSPLLRAQNLGRLLGLPNLYIKDERQGPTASFKDRQAALTVSVLLEAGLKEAVVASTGNVAIAFSAYCARAGVKLWAFITSLVPAPKMHEVAIYGTRLIKVASTYDQTKHLAAQFAQERGLYIDRGVRSIAAVESMKTLAFEIAEQLGNEEGVATSWRAPDWYIQSVSGGIGPVGVLKGFTELLHMQHIEKIPAIACIQTAGCSPMADAWHKGLEQVVPVLSPNTLISTLSTGDPGRTYSLLRGRMLAGSGGAMESVTDEEAFQAMHTLAKMEGLSIEPAAAVAFAGLIKMVRNGKIHPEETIVVNCSGHTMPIEKSLLADGWAQDVVLPDYSTLEQPEEGLLAALEHLDSERIHDILIVDDHADARLLISRILQAQADYNLVEASSGMQALELAEQNPPDLVILDLMMPEMDGFSVLERLKQSSKTIDIPVIVITAKQLSVHEKERLRGKIARLLTKGDFLSEELLAEIERILG